MSQWLQEGNEAEKEPWQGADETEMEEHVDGKPDRERLESNGRAGPRHAGTEQRFSYPSWCNTLITML